MFRPTRSYPVEFAWGGEVEDLYLCHGYVTPMMLSFTLFRVLTHDQTHLPLQCR